MNEDIKAILKRKQRGIDCTEQESAELKMFLKNIFFRVRRGKLYSYDKVELIAGIEELFSVEFGEALDETNKFKK